MNIVLKIKNSIITDNKIYFSVVLSASLLLADEGSQIEIMAVPCLMD